MAGVVIAGVSLLVSVYVLWSTRLRAADLVLAAEPGSYRTTFEGERFLLRVPIVVVNNGARTGVVTGLRFEVPSDWGSPDQYAFVHRTYQSMDEDGPDARTFFEPIAVSGASTVLSICEFIVLGVGPDQLANGQHFIALEMPEPAGTSVSWTNLGSFSLRVSETERAGFPGPMTHFNGFRN